jgi:hypothetical protein
MSCSGCSYKPLNGLPLGGNTEGGRLQKEIAICAKSYTNNKPSSPYACNPYKTTIQPTITQASGNRTSDLALGCTGSVTGKGGVTAERVQELLKASMTNNFSSETARITRLEQKTILCNPSPAIPVPIIITQCPPLPPVPGPPYVCKPSRIAPY